MGKNDTTKQKALKTGIAAIVLLVLAIILWVVSGAQDPCYWTDDLEYRCPGALTWTLGLVSIIASGIVGIVACSCLCCCDKDKQMVVVAAEPVANAAPAQA